MEEQHKYVSMGEPGPTMLFIFTMLTMMFWGMYTGFFDASAVLLLGLIQLACFPAYIFGGIAYILKGDSISGNTYLIFATCFGGIGGVSNLVSYISTLNGIPVESKIVGLVWLWSGLILIPIVASMRKGPSIPFVVFTLGALELILMGLMDLGFIPLAATNIVLVCFASVGIGGFYCSAVNLFSFGNIKLPLGRSLFK